VGARVCVVIKGCGKITLLLSINFVCVVCCVSSFRPRYGFYIIAGAPLT